MAVNGEAPQVFECVRCADKERPAVFSVSKGGLVCSECQKTAGDGVQLLASTLYAMQYIISSPVEKLYTFAVKEEVLEQLGKIVRAYLDVYVEKRFKSLEILETIVR